MAEPGEASHHHVDHRELLRGIGIGHPAASKAYVNSFTQALHAELEPAGVHVTCVAPGYTRTEFQERADYDASGMPDFMWQSADEVARIALESLEQNKALVVPGIPNKVMVGALRPLPLWLQRRITSAGSG